MALMAAGAPTDSVRALLDVESLQVIGEISPQDGMYLYDPTLYAEAGQVGLRMTRLAMLAAGLDRVGKVLDFACGAGRVLRYLKAGFPDASITACDVTAHDVEFCARAFGVNGVVSHPDPSRIELDGPFDVIWCGSLLTHVDAGPWVQFLQLMERNLSPGGVLVFTVYGSLMADLLRTGINRLDLSPQQAEQVVRDYERTGFGFGAAEGRPEEGFGDCVASPPWVTTTLAEVTDLRLVLYTERAWIKQDVIACTK
jgi:SAM-dependent methyltransferase